MPLIPIKKNLFQQDSICKAMEAFLIQRGRTIYTNGLNIWEKNLSIIILRISGITKYAA